MDEYLTSAGVTIPLRHVSKAWVERIYAKYPMPEVPTYTAELVGGGTQDFEHDETTLESADDFRRWQQYQDDRTQAISDRLQEVAEFLLYNCIELDPPPLEEWSVDFDFWDLDKPDSKDKKQYKLDWIELELLADPDDEAAVMAKLYQMGGVIDSGKVKEFEEFFRLALGRVSSSREGD
jgi:hypothetical protein